MHLLGVVDVVDADIDHGHVPEEVCAVLVHKVQRRIVADDHGIVVGGLELALQQGGETLDARLVRVVLGVHVLGVEGDALAREALLEALPLLGHREMGLGVGGDEEHAVVALALERLGGDVADAGTGGPHRLEELDDANEDERDRQKAQDKPQDRIGLPQPAVSFSAMCASPDVHPEWAAIFILAVSRGKRDVPTTKKARDETLASAFDGAGNQT